MYRLSRPQIEQMVYSNTPIDTIVSTKDLPNGIQVNGYTSNNQNISFNFYDNGQVIKL